MCTPRASLIARRPLLVGLLVALLGCGRTADSKGTPGAAGAAGTHVKLALNWVPEPEFGGFYAGRDAGTYKRAGVDLEILGGGAGVPVVQMVATGQVDFGVIGADELINARTHGADVIPVFATYQTSPQGIMAHAARGAKSMADVFSGGTLAIEPGAAHSVFLKKKYGFDKVKVVPYDGGVARFVADKDFAQQCFISSEPIAATRKGSDPRVFLIADEGYNPYTTVVITRRALWKEHPERVRAFARATREGWRAYLDDAAPANAVMSKLNPTMDAETWPAATLAQKPFIETEETRKGKLGMMTRQRWETLGKQLVELGIVEKAPPVDDYFFAVDD